MPRMGRILLAAAAAPAVAVCLIASAALAETARPAQTPGPTSKTFELSGGRFTEVATTKPETLPKPDPALKHIEAILDRQDFRGARNEALDWALANKGDPNYDEALFLIAQAFNGGGDPVKAFYYCDAVMDGYPASAYYTAALQLQYDIADGLLGGRHIKILGLRIFSGTDEGIEMMFRIQQRAPGDPLAEKSLRRTADFYFSQGDFDLAADAYGAHVKAYPRDPNLTDILLRQAFSNYAQFTGVRFDPTPLVNARSQMQDMIDKYPDVAQRENLQSFVDSIDKTLARKLYVTADFYRRTGKPEAQRTVLAVLVKQYPQSDEAQQAKTTLDRTILEK